MRIGLSFTGNLRVVAHPGGRVELVVETLPGPGPGPSHRELVALQRLWEIEQSLNEVLTTQLRVDLLDD